MSMKPKKSAPELKAMIMEEVRKHPDWSYVSDVTILPNIGAAPHHPNWKFSFTHDGTRIAPPDAEIFARVLSSQYDWDETR
jgi:hypothetical protein